MKTEFKSLIAAVFACIAFSTASQAQSNVVDNLNEYGAGSTAVVGGTSYNFLRYISNPTYPFFYSFASDFGPGLPPTLAYSYASTVLFNTGSIILTDGGGQAAVVNFYTFLNSQSQNYDSIAIYSLRNDGTPAYNPYPGSLAGLPQVSASSTYTPDASSPGYVPGYAVSYNFLLVPVPEPSSLALLGAGAAAALFFRKRN